MSGGNSRHGRKGVTRQKHGREGICWAEGRDGKERQRGERVQQNVETKGRAVRMGSRYSYTYVRVR
jgi:hypothetical protein